jgi:alpha(1,3/1,4) fucosyltransferase
LFCSTMHGMKTANKYDCPKIVYTAENHRLEGRGSYTIGFDPHSDTNYYLPLWQVYMILNPEYFGILKNRIYEEHIGFCSAVISNGSAKYRNDIFDKIDSYKIISSYGLYKNNSSGIVPRSGDWHNGKIDFFRENPHKFMLACESASFPGYCTEKLMDAFLCKSVPIYCGDPYAAEWFNKKAFIQTDGKMIDNIRLLDENRDMMFNIMNEPVFHDEDKVVMNIYNFEGWLVEKVKQLMS